VQSSTQIIIINKPTSSLFYRPDALHVAKPTVSEHRRKADNKHKQEILQILQLGLCGGNLLDSVELSSEESF